MDLSQLLLERVSRLEQLMRLPLLGEAESRLAVRPGSFVRMMRNVAQIVVIPDEHVLVSDVQRIPMPEELLAWECEMWRRQHFFQMSPVDTGGFLAVQVAFGGDTGEAGAVFFRTGLKNHLGLVRGLALRVDGNAELSLRASPVPLEKPLQKPLSLYATAQRLYTFGSAKRLDGSRFFTKRPIGW